MQKKAKKIRPPLKTHGGKYYLANWIIKNFPENYENMNYVELFSGGASVLLNKNPSTQEIINDVDDRVIAVFKSLRDEPKEFIGRIKRTKYTEKTFKLAQSKSQKTIDDYVDLAINEFVLRRMSRGGLKKTFAWSDRVRGGQPGDVNAWDTIIELLPEIANRVKDTIMVCSHFADVMKVFDEEETFFYIDPPYLHSTRAEGSENLYDHEITVEDHMTLLALANNARGKVLISGYASPLYSRSLKGWKCEKKDVANNSSQSKTKSRRVECLWYNY